MAGALGLEPRNAGSKGRCLTNLATPHPAGRSHFRGNPQVSQRRHGRPAGRSGAYFSSLSFRPSPATLMFAPLVSLFRLITTPLLLRSEETPAPLPAVPSAP